MKKIVKQALLTAKEFNKAADEFSKLGKAIHNDSQNPLKVVDHIAYEDRGIGEVN